MKTTKPERDKITHMDEEATAWSLRGIRQIKINIIKAKKNQEMLSKKEKKRHNYGEYLMGKLPSDVLMDIYQQEAHMASIAMDDEKPNYKAWRYHRLRMFSIRKVMGQRRRYGIRHGRHMKLRAAVKRSEQRRLFNENNIRRK